MTLRSSYLRHVALAAAFLVVSATAAAPQTRLAPADEAASDVSWTRFKSRLLTALEKRDQKALLGIVDSRIRNISGTNGAPEFRKLWRPHSADSPLWAELPRLLSLGGVFIKRDQGATELCVPYLRYQWPADVPPGANAAIVAKEVLLKSQPSANAGTRQVLSYDIVTALDWEVADDSQKNTQKWVNIQTGNVSGYVPEEQIRSPLEHHACFVKSGAGWRMIAFGVGE